MTQTALDRIPAPAPAGGISQVTAVEQARAVAEVQAAVVVAQQCPRDMTRAHSEMRDSCGKLRLAERAFFRVPNRGNGPSVHLARELARVWGNIDYGVKEMRRDDRAGISEVLAYAWDVQTNTRSTRTFIVPHQRMVKGERTPLTDLGDIYLNNQNVGARAVRECIWTVLPTAFVEEAVSICHQTLEHGEGKPLAQRIEEMVAAFAALGVKVKAIEDRLGKRRGQWDAGSVAEMTIAWQSITRGETTVEDEFPSAAPVAAASFRPTPGMPVDVPDSEVIPDALTITAPQRRKLFACFGDAGWPNDANTAEGRARRLAYISGVVGREVASTNDLTVDEASRVIEALVQDASEVSAPEAADTLPGVE